MKEINKSELVEILEDYGVDVAEHGIRTADIDNFLSAELSASEDELEPIYNIVCQEIMTQRPDLVCRHEGPQIKVVHDENVVTEFEIIDADFTQDGTVDLILESTHGDTAVVITDSGEVEMGTLLERIEQSEVSHE